MTVAFGSESGTAKSSRGPSAWATHAALLLVQVAFASQAVEAKLAMLPRAQGGEEIRPETLAMVRMIGGALFFQAAVLSNGAGVLQASRGDAEPVRAPAAAAESSRLKRHAKLALLAALGVAVNQALFLAGLRASTPFVVSILGATIPVLTAALAVLFRKERASWRTGVGLVLALTGVLWLTGVGSVASQGAAADYGAMLVALNCLSYSAYVVFSRDVVIELGTSRLMAWVFTYGALLFAPLGLAPLLSDLPEISGRGWALLAYIVLVPTILAYGLNAWALARTTASIVTIYIYLQPLIAGLLARIQLGHSVSSRAGFASLLILAGVAVTTLRLRAPSRAPAADGDDAVSRTSNDA
jgi:drug/metabolite transporter (DMT)-like permease